MNYFKKNSLRKSLVSSLIVLSIVPLLLVGIILSWQNVTVLKLQARDSQKKLTMLVANKMSSYIHEFEASLETAVRTNDVMDMQHDQQSLLLSKMLFSAIDPEHRDVFKGLILLNSDGKELVHVSRERLYTNAQLIDRSGSEEFTIPLASKEIYYSTVFFNEQTGEPYIDVSVPIIDFRSTRLRGVLIAQMSLKHLWDAIADVRVGTTGITYILSEKGRVIAHPNPSVVLRGTYYKLPRANGIVTGLHGKKSYMVIDTLMFGNQPLTIVTELPVSEALHYALLSLYIILGFLIISLMGAVLLGYILVRQIVQPIESMSGTAQLISKGDFSQRMRAARADEIGALADAFNSMTSRLINTIDSLKKEMVERKQIEGQILQKNELLNNILNSIANPFYVIDASDYTIKLANEAARFGLLSEDSKCHVLTHNHDEPCSGDEHPCTIREIKRTKKPVILEHIHYDSEGHAVFFDVHGYPIFDSNGNIVQVIEYTVDVTARKKLEHQFLQAQKMEAVGQLAGGIAHDFNNLLSAVLGYAEMALMDIPDDHPAHAKLRTIMEAGEKATVLTRQLLTFSRKQIMDMKVVSLNSIVENMAKILNRLIGENISLELNTRADVKNVKADASQMEQVLMNLVVNARDAMPNGGRLTMETENVELDEEYARSHEGIKPGPYVMLAVTDTGTGMSREVQDRIFEPFYTTKGVQGTGLGLSTIYGIIKQHGGSIFVYSEPNVGTTFKIYLPATAEAPKKEFTEERDIMIHGTETILVVEDEPSILRLVADSLQPLGYKILEASCGREALEIVNARGGEIDLLLTDVIMPEMSGTELAAIVRTIRPSIKIVFMSGYTDETIFHDFPMDSDMSFLQKPLTPRKLVSKLNEALNKKVA